MEESVGIEPTQVLPRQNLASSLRTLQLTFHMVSSVRLERTAYGLEGRCSIQLSYEEIYTLIN